MTKPRSAASVLTAAAPREEPVIDTPPRIDDPRHVRQEYADDTRLSARRAFWTARSGPQPADVALERIVDMQPAAVLEVGCGQGAFAQALTSRGLQVTAVDQSEHMVGLTAARGVTARQADVQRLPFDDDTFDVVAANYMLYHVPDLPRALEEIIRVLRPGGVLVAVTNSERQLEELWSLVGRDVGLGAARVFGSENGAGILGAAFAHVEQIDLQERFEVSGQAALRYVRATRLAALGDPDPAFPSSLTVTAAGSVFVATAPYPGGGQV